MYKVLSIAGNDAEKFEAELNRFVEAKWEVIGQLQMTYDPVTEKFVFSVLLTK